MNEPIRWVCVARAGGHGSLRGATKLVRVTLRWPPEISDVLLIHGNTVRCKTLGASGQDAPDLCPKEAECLHPKYWADRSVAIDTIKPLNRFGSARRNGG